jgi:23S rRNA (guanosine2251-2'-O)-methyltransferase
VARAGAHGRAFLFSNPRKIGLFCAKIFRIYHRGRGAPVITGAQRATYERFSSARSAILNPLSSPSRHMEHLEGTQSVLAALHARQRRFEVILVRHDSNAEKVPEVLALAQQLGVPVRMVEGAELNALAHGSSHGGVLAIVSPKPRLNADQMLDLVDALREPPLLLLFEGVDDERNLGFTLRTAEAMGVHAVLIKKHLWDFDGTEVARPASGAYERLPLVQIEDVGPLHQLQRRGLRLYGCLATTRRTMYATDLARPCILAIGGEKRGLSGAVRSICDQFVTIPTVGGASSLSLSHASAILLSEALRQRWKGGEGNGDGY